MTPTPLSILRELVEAQAEDDGLWFNAETASEAYLQAALRRLHAAVEAMVSAPPEVVGLTQREVDAIYALRHADEWVTHQPHGDNCFVSNHYEGDPGNRCNCGKDAAEQAIGEALLAYPEAMDDDGEPLEIAAGTSGISLRAGAADGGATAPPGVYELACVSKFFADAALAQPHPAQDGATTPDEKAVPAAVDTRRVPDTKGGE